MPDWDFNREFKCPNCGAVFLMLSHYFEHIELDCKGKK